MEEKSGLNYEDNTLKYPVTLEVEWQMYFEEQTESTIW
jgi:hypothetical protein